MSIKVGWTNNSSDKQTKCSFCKFMWSKEIMHQLLKQAETSVTARKTQRGVDRLIGDGQVILISLCAWHKNGSTFKCFNYKSWYFPYFSVWYFRTSLLSTAKTYNGHNLYLLHELSIFSFTIRLAMLTRVAGSKWPWHLTPQSLN